MFIILYYNVASKALVILKLLYDNIDMNTHRISSRNPVNRWSAFFGDRAVTRRRKKSKKILKIIVRLRGGKQTRRLLRGRGTSDEENRPVVFERVTNINANKSLQNFVCRLSVVVVVHCC